MIPPFYCPAGQLPCLAAGGRRAASGPLPLMGASAPPPPHRAELHLVDSFHR